MIVKIIKNEKDLDFKKIQNLIFENKQKNIEKYDKLEFESCTFSDNLVFSNLLLDTIKFSDCKINYIKFEKYVSIENIKFDENTSVRKIEFVDIDNFEIKKIEIRNSMIEKMELKCIECNYFYIIDSIVNKILIRNIKINKELYFNNEQLNEKTISIHQLELDYVRLNWDSILTFKKINFHSLKFDNFLFVPRYFYIFEVMVEKELKFSKSNLSSFIIDDLDISLSQNYFDKTRFIGEKYTKLSNVKWGIINYRRYISDRDTIRQLKHVNDQQGNYIQANKFYSLEMEKYGEEVSPFKNFQEWLVFMISKNLSNFSQDWVLPILWFGFMSMFLFNILTIFTISGLDYGDLWFPIQMMFSNFKWIFVLHFLFLFVCLFNSKDYYYILLKRLLGYANLAAFLGSITVYINVWGSFPESLISFEQFIMFANPLQFNLPKNYNWLYLVMMILHRLFTFVIGYHLVTALRFNTRRK